MASILLSIVDYHSEQNNYKCGYCKSPNGNFSHGMWAHTLTVQDYQNLIDRGWRRSGSYCYKPTMNKICCPAYTIRCDALNFKISKSQKKILKRMSNFLKNKLNKDEKMSTSNTNIVHHHHKLDEIPGYKEYAKRADSNMCKINVASVSGGVKNKTQLVQSSLNSCMTESDGIKESSASSSSNDHLLTVKNIKPNKNQCVNECDNVPQKKAKLLRLERKKNKLLLQGKTSTEIETILSQRKQQQIYSKSVEEYFDEFGSQENKLEMKLVRTAPISSEYINTENKSFQLFKKYQMKIHGDQNVTMKKYTRFLVKSALQTIIIQVERTEAKWTYTHLMCISKK